MFNVHDLTRNEYMLTGPLANEGYDWWWHSFTGRNKETGEEKAFFIEFFLCNPGLGRRDPVLGQAIENLAKGNRPSYLMVKAGCWGEGKMQLHRFFGWKDIKLERNAPYSVSADDCYSSDFKLKGHVSVKKEDAFSHPEWMSDAGEMSWDLEVDKQVAFNVGYGASKPLRVAQAFEMYWHAEGMKTAYSGTVIANGVEYVVDFENSYGYADKNWGRNFTSPWVWLSSNNLVSRISGEQLKDSVFDIGGGRPKVYQLPREKKLLGAFWYEGTEYEFNFSKPWMLPKTEFECRETEDEVVWHVVQSNTTNMWEVNIRCFKKDMLLVNYEAPDGTKKHDRLWNGGNGTGNIKLYRKVDSENILIDDIDVFNCGCEYGEYRML